MLERFLLLYPVNDLNNVLNGNISRLAEDVIQSNLVNAITVKTNDLLIFDPL